MWTDLQNLKCMMLSNWGGQSWCLYHFVEKNLIGIKMPKKNRKSFAMRIKNWTRVILCLIMSWNGLTSAEVTEFRVGQVWQHLADITVYLHIRNENGETIRNLEHNSTDAFIGSKMVPIRDIKPFDPDKEGVSYIFLVD